MAALACLRGTAPLGFRHAIHRSAGRSSQPPASVSHVHIGFDMKVAWFNDRDGILNIASR